jgi:hypothetical protein
MSNRLLSHTIAILWMVLNSNGFLIFTLAVLSWIVTALVIYGSWIVAKEIVQILEDILRVLLQIP